jgi:hypothetical protein
MPDSFHVNMSSYGSVVLATKNFLHFGNYLPFVKDVALYLYSFEFPLFKESLNEIGLLVLARKIF